MLVMVISLSSAVGEAASQLLRVRGGFLFPFDDFPAPVNDADDSEHDGDESGDDSETGVKDAVVTIRVAYKEKL